MNIQWLPRNLLFEWPWATYEAANYLYTCPAPPRVAFPGIYPADVSNDEFQLFPNPSSQSITVQSPVEVIELAIYDLTGRLVSSHQYDSDLSISDMHGRTVVNQEVPVPSVIHLEHVAPGAYVCALHTQEGEFVESAIVVKR